MKFCRSGLLLMSFAAMQFSQAQTAPAPAATPPMGWNSWDSYGLTITEPQFRANATVLRNQLAPSGYNYAVIDEGWFFVNPEDRPQPEKLIYAIDANGRYVPVPVRFPSATALDSATPALLPQPAKPGSLLYNPYPSGSVGFKPLADWLHSQGLKFGIHIVRGIPRVSVQNNLPIADSSFHAADAADTTDACPWDPTNWGVRDNAAGQAWYDSLISQYAGWGVDLIKVDCISANPYKADEIRMIRKAIDKTGRPIVLSLSPGPTPLDKAAEVSALANMWRISNDVWDLWTNPKPWPISVSSQFPRAAAWAPYAGPGHWPDCDMLPLGHLGPVPGEGKPRQTRLTPTEQQTMLTLWAMARSPLILGANLTQLDDATLKLLTNPDLIRIDQTASRSGQAMRSGDVIAWTADLPTGETALALFNTGDDQQVIDSQFSAFNLDDDTYRARDVWSGKNLGKLKSLADVTLEPHASILWLLKK